MKVIVVDTEKIIQPNRPRLLNFINKVKCDKTNGVALVVTDSIHNQINLLPKGIQRVDFLNNKTFMSGIISVCYFNYNKKEAVCVIDKIDRNHASLILNQLGTDLPHDTDIVVAAKTAGEAKDVINIGFSSPHKCKDESICLVKSEEDSSLSQKLAHSELSYLLSQRKPICDLSFYLKPSAAKYLRNLLTAKKSRNVELSGLLKSEDVKHNNVYEIDVDKKSISSGEKEEVDGVKALFNFHTHPKEAYIRNEVKYAWPSAQDYLAYLYMAIQEKTVFHCVIALEGLYVLSLRITPRTFDSEFQKHIKKNFKVDDDRHPLEYIKYIHNLPGNVFELQYFPWKEVDKEQIVHVSFKKDEASNNCFINDKALKVFEKIKNAY